MSDGLLPGSGVDLLPVNTLAAGDIDAAAGLLLAYVVDGLKTLSQPPQSAEDDAEPVVGAAVGLGWWRSPRRGPVGQWASGLGG